MQTATDRQMFRQCVETFAPERAEHILEHKMPRNRPVNRLNVEYLKNELRTLGGFSVVNDSICFDWFGNLINGQQRLIAIRETGISATQPVMHGLDPDSFRFMDRGVVRTLATDFQMDNLPYAGCLAATINLVVRFDEKRMHNNYRKLSPTEAASFVKANPKVFDLCRATNSSMTRRRSWITTPSIATAVWFVIDRVDSEKASEFMERFSDGAGLDLGSPILALRSHLLNRQSQLGVNLRKSYTMALCIKAWNAFRSGRRTTMLKFLPTEEFPVPV